MRTQSAYVFDCAACGEHMESHKAAGVCLCGVAWRIDSDNGVNVAIVAKLAESSRGAAS